MENIYILLSGHIFSARGTMGEKFIAEVEVGWLLSNIGGRVPWSAADRLIKRWLLVVLFQRQGTNSLYAQSESP